MIEGPVSLPAPPERMAENVPIAPLTTIGIGGPARYYLRATSVDELILAAAWARNNGIPMFPLGGGSNLLVSDEGFPGLVLHVDLRGVTLITAGKNVEVNAAAGEPWDSFVEWVVENSFAGLECLSGIPGSVGATPIQNVGAYGQDVSETIVRVEALELETLTTRWFSNAECEFAYRDSRFKGVDRGRYIILSVSFRLIPGGAASVRYPELRGYLDERGESAADLRQVRDAVLAIRKRKGMVIDSNDPDSKSDGSFFTNPIIEASELPSFLARAAQSAGAEAPVPQFPAGEGRVKLSAAWLIEHAGFTRGLVRGRAGISSRHTLALINRGGATAAEMLALVEEIQGSVREKFGVELVPEPNFIGFH